MWSSSQKIDFSFLRLNLSDDYNFEMNDNDIVQFTEGTFMFTNTLSIDDKINVTLIGAGKNKTILDFSSQTGGGSGAQGIIATATDQILFKDFTIQDADGDNIKVKDSDGVSFVNLVLFIQDQSQQKTVPTHSILLVLKMCWSLDAIFGVLLMREFMWDNHKM